MKKRTLLFLTMVLFSTGIFAQEFGLRAGVNITSQEADGDGITIETDSKTGFYVGAIAKFGLADALKLRLELNYATYGYKFEFADEETTTNLNHLDIPILFEYNLRLGDALGAYVNAGPQIGYALSGSDDDEDIDFDEYNRLDFGLAFGGGVGFGVAGDNMLYLEIRYFLGLANLNDSDQDVTLNNRGLQIGLAYML